MPYDNPPQLPVGDIDILIDVQSAISHRNTWVQNRFRDGNRKCLVAALSLACGSPAFSQPNPTERRLARVLAKELPSNAPLGTRLRLIPARQRLMWFNDHNRTAHADVLALLDRAINHMASKMPAYA